MSMHNIIAQAVAAVISNMDTPPTVTVRKELIRLDGDTLPLCIVSEEGEQRDGKRQFGAGGNREYDIRVTYLRSGKMQSETNLDSAPDMIERIKQTFRENVTLAGVPEVWDSDIKPAPVVKPGSVNSGYDQPTFIVTFKTNEAA